jgi:TM2 domain-containing membrane protein YozV
MRLKKLWVAYLLWFFFGFLGIHKFYLGKPVAGILYILTAGLFFIGWFLDLFTIPSQVDLYNLKMQNPYTSEHKQQHAEQDRMDEVMERARGLEERLQNVEDIVTSKEFDFFRKLHRKH